MKRFIVLFLSLVLIFTFSACVSPDEEYDRPRQVYDYCLSPYLTGKIARLLDVSPDELKVSVKKPIYSRERGKNVNLVEFSAKGYSLNAFIKDGYEGSFEELFANRLIYYRDYQDKFADVWADGTFGAGCYYYGGDENEDTDAVFEGFVNLLKEFDSEKTDEYAVEYPDDRVAYICSDKCIEDIGKILMEHRYNSLAAKEYGNEYVDNLVPYMSCERYDIYGGYNFTFGLYPTEAAYAISDGNKDMNLTVKPMSLYSGIGLPAAKRIALYDPRTQTGSVEIRVCTKDYPDFPPEESLYEAAIGDNIILRMPYKDYVMSTGTVMSEENYPDEDSKRVFRRVKELLEEFG